MPYKSDGGGLFSTFCRHCGGYVGVGKRIVDAHDHPTDCIEALVERLKALEARP